MNTPLLATAGGGPPAGGLVDNDAVRYESVEGVEDERNGGEFSGETEGETISGGNHPPKIVSGQELPETAEPPAGQGSNASMPTNNYSMPTNENGQSTNAQNRQLKRGWIEWPSHHTKKFGKRRYPRQREWLWDNEAQSWVKSNPLYSSRTDLKPMNEEDYVKYAKRRDRARKLGF